MGWELLLAKFLTDLGVEVGPSLGKLLGQAISELIDDIRAATYTPDLMEYAFLIAAGVMTKNPTMNLTFQAELVTEGIRLLMTNPAVKRPPTPLSVQALATLSLVRAGFLGVTP